MGIKLIALDLDGTTLNGQGVISERTRVALNAATQKGVNIVVATGRPFCALPKDVFEIEAIRYVLTSNGASITDLKKEETIYENCLAAVTVERASELLCRYDYILECFVKGNAYIEKWYYDKVKETNESFRGVEYILGTREPVDDIYAFMLEHRLQIENINVNFENIYEKPAMKEKLLQLPQATITSSFKHNLEIGGETTSKAEALRKMCDIFGIVQDEIMAVGDSPNDIKMLEVAGMSVAMGNAEDEVKAIAEYVAPTNAEDGVAVSIEKFVL